MDVEILVADTIRIASDDAVINNARAAITLRGAANVRLVATKIDVSLVAQSAILRPANNPVSHPQSTQSVQRPAI